jgi:hypothetical protein
MISVYLAWVCLEQASRKQPERRINRRGSPMDFG